MEKYVEIANSNEYEKIVQLTKLFQGHVVSFKHHSYVDFYYNLTPTESSSVIILCGDDSSKLVIEEIHQGILHIINRFGEEKINIRGIKIEIYNSIIHDIDFKPSQFRLLFMIEFLKLIYLEGVKSFRNKKYKISLAKYSLNSSNRNEYDPYSENFISVAFIKQHMDSRDKLRLSYNIEEHIPLPISDKMFDVKMILFPSRNQFDSINIYCEFKKPNIFVSYSIIKSVKDFLKELEIENNIQLGGFDIWFAVEINDDNFKDNYYHYIEITNYYTSCIHWKLKEIFMEHGAIFKA